MIVLLVSVVVYFVSFLLTMALSRYRELAADRSGALLIGRPSLLASALVKITGEMGRIPTKDLRAAEPFNAFFFTPAVANGADAGRGRRLQLRQPLPDAPDARASPGPAGLARAPARPGRLGQPARTSGWDSSTPSSAGTKPVRANLDALFALPTAALTLQSAGGLVTSGHAGVCWKPPPGQGAADAQKEISELVGEGFGHAQDSFDYGWLLARRPRPRRAGDQDPHGQLDAAGQRLGAPAAVLGRSASSPVPTRPATPGPSGSSTSSSAAPSIPSPRSTREKERRDTELELRIRTMVGADLPVEPDLTRWFPLWDMPVA